MEIYESLMTIADLSFFYLIKSMHAPSNQLLDLQNWDRRIILLLVLDVLVKC